MARESSNGGWLPVIGGIPHGWQIVEFGEVLDGGTRNGIYKKKEFHGRGAKIVNMGELFAHPRLFDVEMKRVELTDKELEKSALQIGDLLFARRSLVAEGAGKCCVVCDLSEPTTFESSIIRARPNKAVVDSLFLYYLFSSPFGRYSLDTIRRVVAVAGITGSDLVTLEIPVPPLSKQKAIARILGTLDDKIELNRRMNETLEAMARAIFKSWFVDFDPVRAKMDGRKPPGMGADIAALFPDSFEHSNGELMPTGWSVDTLKNRAANVQYGFTQSASDERVGPRFLRITDIRGGRVDWSSVPFCEAGDVELVKYGIKDGDIFVARTGASTGENIYVVDPPNSVFASYLVRIQFASRGIGRFVGEFMRTLDYFEYVAGAIGGSAQPNASAQTLAAARVMFPSDEVATAFNDIVRPLDVRRSANARESETLAALRDTLLPRLLSGEIRVADAERFVAADKQKSERNA